MDHLTLKITPAKVVETSVNNKSPSQDSNHTEVLFQSRCTNNNHKHRQQLPTYLALIVVNPIHRTYSIFTLCFLCQTVIREGTLVQINPWEVGTRQTKKCLHCKGNTSKFLQPNICLLSNIPGFFFFEPFKSPVSLPTHTSTMLDSHGQRRLKPRGSARSLRPWMRWMRLTKVGVQGGVSLHKKRYRANETQTTELEVRKQLKNN